MNNNNNRIPVDGAWFFIFLPYISLYLFLFCVPVFSIIGVKQ